MCPHEPVNTICKCRCSSLKFTVTNFPEPYSPHQQDALHCGQLAGLCQVTTATQVMANSHWEVILNLAVGVFTQLKVAGLCFLYRGEGGKRAWKTEEPHSTAQASWTNSNWEGKEIMNQIIGNGNGAAKDDLIFYWNYLNVSDICAELRGELQCYMPVKNQLFIQDQDKYPSDFMLECFCHLYIHGI